MKTQHYREQERLENRDKRLQVILDIGRELFIKKGLARVNMKEVAEAAKISRATLYRYFSTKEDLALAIERHLFNDILLPEYHQRIQSAEGTGLDKVAYHIQLVVSSFEIYPDYYKFTGAFDHYFNFSRKPRELAEEMQQIFQKEGQQDPLIGFIREGIEDGSICETLDPDLTAKTIDQTLLSICQRIASRSEVLSIELQLTYPHQMVNSLVDLILNGLKRS